MRSRTAVVAGAFLLLLQCQDGERVTAPEGRPSLEPVAATADGAHGGTPHFFFLSPLVADPTPTAPFDGTLSPVVQICEGPVQGCDTPVAEFIRDADGGSGAVRVEDEDDGEGEHYVVDWHTASYELDEFGIYRISVFVVGTPLGYVDVQVVPAEGGGDADYFSLKYGRTLPIRFRIEEGAVFVVASGGGEVSAAGGEVILEFPENAVSEPIGATVQPTTEFPADPEVVDRTVYEFGPDGTEFEALVAVTVHYDEANLPAGVDESSLRLHKVVGDRWEEVPGSMVDKDANTVSAWLTGFSTYGALPGSVGNPLPYPIAFVSDRDGDREIYVMDGDGSNAINVTDHPSTDQWPAWSPDGNHIAFYSRRTGDRDIYVMDWYGANQTRLTDEPTRDEQPAWSPDGTKIAFATNRDNNFEIYVMDADGTNPTRLTSQGVTNVTPAWSPDGTKIAFVTLRYGSREIYVIDAATGNESRLTDNPTYDIQPAWSPDGTKIAFASDRDGNYEIYVMNADGSDETRVTFHPAEDVMPSWTPDGRIVFVSERAGNRDIHVMNADGTGIVQLTDDPAMDWEPAVRPVAGSTKPGIVITPAANGAVWSLQGGQQKQFVASGYDASYAPLTDFVWESSDARFVHVSEGLVTARRTGRVIIRVTSGPYVESFELEVFAGFPECATMETTLSLHVEDYQPSYTQPGDVVRLVGQLSPRPSQRCLDEYGSGRVVLPITVYDPNGDEAVRTWIYGLGDYDVPLQIGPRGHYQAIVNFNGVPAPDAGLYGASNARAVIPIAPPVGIAIVVVGGNFASELFPTLEYLGDMAVRTFRYVRLGDAGFGSNQNRIWYLHPNLAHELPGQPYGTPDVDDTPSLANLEDALTSWAVQHVAQHAAAKDWAEEAVFDVPLTVYMVGSPRLRENAPDGIWLNETESLDGTTLASYLNTFEELVKDQYRAAGASPPEYVFSNVIIESVSSGSFIEPLSKRGRVILTSTTPDGSSFMTSQGSVSFSAYFLSRIAGGHYIHPAFAYAQLNILSNPFFSGQSPQIEATGPDPNTGVVTPNEIADEVMTASMPLESRPRFNPRPRLQNGLGQVTLRNIPTATLWVYVDDPENDMASVKAMILPPSGSYESPEVIELSRNPSEPNRWEGVYDRFYGQGEYTVIYMAEDGAGLTATPLNKLIFREDAEAPLNPLTRPRLTVVPFNGRFVVNWLPSPSGDVQGYRIYVTPPDGEEYLAADVGNTHYGYIDGIWPPSGTYTFRVVAYDRVPLESPGISVEYPWPWPE